MSNLKGINGYRVRELSHLINPGVPSASRPDPGDYAFDLERTLNSVVSLRAEVPEDAFTATILGTSRDGNGVVIDDRGLVLTIGYLITEAEEVTLLAAGGHATQATPLAYDFETGFGLVRANQDLGVEPMAFGNAANLAAGEKVVIGAFGGVRRASVAQIASKREFAGYWEYILDMAIFTTPPHPMWSGAALIAQDGTLAGIGSLFVQDALPAGDAIDGNMFVPIDILPPVLDDLVTSGQVDRPPRPWLGMMTTDAHGGLLIAGLAETGPAHRAGVEIGDHVTHVAGQPVMRLIDMLRRIWALGAAGTLVPLTLMRDGDIVEVEIRSANRYDFLKAPARH